MLHIPIVHAHDVSKQIPREKNFPTGWKCCKTIGSYVSCAFIEIWSTWEVWRALRKLELLSVTPRATLTHPSCSPNLPRASYLDERTLTYEPIVNSQTLFTENWNWIFYQRPKCMRRVLILVTSVIAQTRWSNIAKTQSRIKSALLSKMSNESKNDSYKRLNSPEKTCSSFVSWTAIARK